MATLSEKQAKLFTDRKVSHTPGSDEAYRRLGQCSGTDL
jgi:hypothetical protein